MPIERPLEEEGSGSVRVAGVGPERADLPVARAGVEGDRLGLARAGLQPQRRPPPLPRDGLQPDERGIENDIKREQAAKEKRDVVLDEAAHILADEISLIRTDTKLASRVLPRGVVMPAEVD